jgi:hypothetical protein
VKAGEELEKSFEEFAAVTSRFAQDAISFVPIEQLRKVLFYYEEMKQLAAVPGDLVEFGVFRGSTLCFLSDANLILDGANSSRSIIGFDTFQGFTGAAPEPKWRRDVECRDMFRETSKAIVLRKLEGRAGHRVRLVEGDILETLPPHFAAWPNKIAMAICDVDVARPTRFALDHIWDRMSPGGRIYLDEYSRDGWSETVGVDEFLKERGLALSRVRRTPGVPFAYIQIP